jgi:hypothetical protein
MLEDLVYAWPLGGILLEDVGDEAASLFGEAVWDLEVALEDLLLHDGFVVIVKGQGAA